MALSSFVPDTRDRFTSRHSLPIRVFSRGGPPIIAYQITNSLQPLTGQTHPMEEPSTSRLGKLLLEMYHAYRDLEAEHTPLIKQIDDLENTNAQLKGKVMSLEGALSKCKGKKHD
jgi:hypothetical protein